MLFRSRWWQLPPEYHCNNLKFPSKPETKVYVPTHHVIEDVEAAEGIDMCSSFITALLKYVGRIYPTVPTHCVLGPVQCELGHVIANVNQSDNIEGGWKLVTNQGKSHVKPNTTSANILSKLGAANKAKPKPKKKYKKKKRRLWLQENSDLR